MIAGNRELFLILYHLRKSCSIQASMYDNDFQIEVTDFSK